MKNPFLIGLASALITAGAIRAAPALAQDAAPEDTIVRLVQVSDLDLQSKAGQRQLERRLAKAAREVCGTASDADLRGKNEVRQCRDEALSRAHAQHNGALAAVKSDRVIAVSAAR